MEEEWVTRRMTSRLLHVSLCELPCGVVSVKRMGPPVTIRRHPPVSKWYVDAASPSRRRLAKEVFGVPVNADRDVSDPDVIYSHHDGDVR